VFGKAIREKLGAQIRLAPNLELRASAVGKIGARILACGAGISAEELAPRYLRRAEAEVKRTGERFEAAR